MKSSEKKVACDDTKDECDKNYMGDVLIEVVSCIESQANPGKCELTIKVTVERAEDEIIECASAPSSCLGLRISIGGVSVTPPTEDPGSPQQQGQSWIHTFSGTYLVECGNFFTITGELGYARCATPKVAIPVSNLPCPPCGGSSGSSPRTHQLK